MCVILTYLQEQKIKIDRDLVVLSQWLACPPLTYGKSCVRVPAGTYQRPLKKGKNCLPAISWDQSHE